MTTNLSMIQKIQRYLYEPETVGLPQLITQDMVLDLYNSAIQELCLETDINFRQYLYTEATSALPLSKTFAELTGSVETDLYSLTELLIQDNESTTYRDLWRTNMKDKLNMEDFSTNIIYAVNIYDDAVHFSSGLVKDNEIAISGRWKKATQTASGNFPLHPMAEGAVVYFSVAQACYIKGQLEKGNTWFNMYTYKKKAITEYFDKLVKSKDPHAIRAIQMSNSPLRGLGSPVFPTTIPKP